MKNKDKSNTKKTKILFIHHKGDEQGGAENSFFELIYCLYEYEKDFIISVIVPPGGLAEKLIKENIKVYQISSISGLKIPEGLGELLILIMRIFKGWLYLAKIVAKERPEIIHANSKFACIYALFPAFIFGKRLIWHERDVKRHPFLDNILCFFCSKVVCISDFTAESVLNIIPEKGRNKILSKICVVYNGVDLRRYTPLPYYAGNKNKEEILKEEVIPKLISKKNFFFPDKKGGRIIILIPAQFVAWKAHDTVLRAIPIVVSSIGDKNFSFLFCGEVNDKSYVEKLFRMVEELEIRENVLFCEYICNINMLFSVSFAVILPSDSEPFGRVIVEAMASGKPVIAVNKGGPTEIVTHLHDGLLIPPGDHIALAASIIKLIEDPYLYDTLRNNAIEKAKRFSVTHTLENLKQKVWQLKNG